MESGLTLKAGSHLKTLHDTGLSNHGDHESINKTSTYVLTHVYQQNHMKHCDIEETIFYFLVQIYVSLYSTIECPSNSECVSNSDTLEFELPGLALAISTRATESLTKRLLQARMITNSQDYLAIGTQSRCLRPVRHG